MGYSKQQSIKDYTDYIYDHKFNIVLSYNRHKDRLHKFLNFDNKELIKNIFNHDESKFSDEEFEAYRKSFFPTDEERNLDISDELKHAIDHHYKTNKHHPQYYEVLRDEYIIMEDVYIAEMILDWCAMGLKFGNSASEYYWNNKNKIKLNDRVRSKVEEIFKYYINII